MQKRTLCALIVLLFSSCKFSANYARYCGAGEPGSHTIYLGKFTPDSVELYNVKVYDEFGCLLTDHTIEIKNDTIKFKQVDSITYAKFKDTQLIIPGKK